MGILGTIIGSVLHTDELLGVVQEGLYRHRREDIEGIGIDCWNPRVKGTEDEPYTDADRVAIQAAFDIADEQGCRREFVRRLYHGGYNLEEYLESYEVEQLEKEAF